MADAALVSALSGLDGETAVQLINKLLAARPELTPAIVGFACPDLTYAPARAITERRSKGTIKAFNQQQGFGFIACPELQAVFGKDVFLHGRQAGGLEVGTEVSFAVTLSEDNKPQAYDVQPTNPMAMQQPGMMGKGMGKGMDKGMDKGMAGKGGWGGGWGDWGKGGCWDQSGWGDGWGGQGWNGMGCWGEMGGCKRPKGGDGKGAGPGAFKGMY